MKITLRIAVYKIRFRLLKCHGITDLYLEINIWLYIRCYYVREQFKNKLAALQHHLHISNNCAF